MKADALPLSNLYNTLNKGYVVPSYQRPFCWDPEKATDLLSSILEDATNDEKITSIGTFLFCAVPCPPGDHPFGNNSPQSNAPNTIWEVVDGQQRLTVLALIGFCLQERLTELSKEGVAYSPPLELDQLFRTSRTVKGTSVPLLIRDGDNYDKGLESDLARLLNHFAENEPLPSGVGERLTQALAEVRTWVSDNLDDGNFGKFCNYLLMCCQYIQVVADDQDTAFSMFEPLNSTSEPLTAFEVYRSKVIRYIKPTPSFEHTLALLDYDNTKRDDVTGRSNQLIFSMAQAYSGARPKIHLVKLKKYLDGHVHQGFVSYFESGAEFLGSVWLTQALATAGSSWFDDETKNCIRFLRASNHDAAIPLILRYFLTNPTQLPDVVKAIVAFFALWRSGSTTKGLPDNYRKLLTADSGKVKAGPSDNMAVDGGTLKTPGDLKAYLRGKIEKKLGVLAGGKTFEDLWLEDVNQRFLTYDELKTVCRLFIFIDMGASIKSNLVPDDPWTDLDDIEHILPASSHAALPNVNKIGNLTFLPSAVNKSIKAMDWPRKMEIYKLLGTHLKASSPPTSFANGDPLPPGVKAFLADPGSQSLAHLSVIAASGSFDEAEIDKRTKQMLKSVWKVLYAKWLH